MTVGIPWQQWAIGQVAAAPLWGAFGAPSENEPLVERALQAEGMVQPRRPGTHRWWWQSPRSRRQAVAAYICLSPWIVGFVVFIAYPIAATLFYSLNKYPILGDMTWVWFKNYRVLLEDPLFWQSLRVTTIYSLVAVPGSLALGYAIALLLNQKVRWVGVWRTMYFLPSIVPAIASAYLWSWLLNPDYGLVNAGLFSLHLPRPEWFGSPTWVLPAFIIMTLWGSGGNLILYLAALQQVPTALYEAAHIDGANVWSRFVHITVPMTSPVLLFTFLTGIINSFQIFTAAYVITRGGPDNASLFYVVYLFRNGWQYFQMGYASALAWVLLLMMLVLTVITLRVSRRFVYYDYSD